MSEDKNNKKEEIKVVTGDSSDLDFSAVFDHEVNETAEKNEEKKSDKKIVIPKGSSDNK